MANTEPDDRVARLRKGVLELAILALLDDAQAYGGEIVEKLAARGSLAATAGTVYPLLTRLRKAGAVETTWEESPVGPPRKYYRLTSAGHADLAAGARAWDGLATDMSALLKGTSR